MPTAASEPPGHPGTSRDASPAGINRGLVSEVAAPFGGIKQSGLGREGGAEGLHEYQQLKYLSMPGFHT
ncbi:aldehyde dehydrogenase family protein [Streptomyces iakyrus]|uniref:aldehyde dehydrogenase family protein n=1 Tax=Streptomyces iakyrus TaxID=68219 RepID=UPI0037F78F5E